MNTDELRRLANLPGRNEPVTPAEVDEMAVGLDWAADEIDDLNSYYANIMATSGHKDEKHCTCVPALRREIERLTAERDALRSAVEIAEQALVVGEIEYHSGLRDAALAALRQARGEGGE